MKSIIARLNPITNTPVVFIADSKKDGQIDAFVEGQIKRVGIDYYQNSLKLARADAIEVARLFAEHEKLPFDELIVRERLPKQVQQRNRRTNDANLVLAHDNTKKDDKQDNLANAAQALHDDATKGNKKQAERKSTPENPEGAVVRPQDAQPRQKRAYRKKGDKELSKRSAAALKRYQEELQRTAAQNPAVMEPVASDAPKEVQDEAVMQLAMALAKILKGGVL